MATGRVRRTPRSGLSHASVATSRREAASLGCMGSHESPDDPVRGVMDSLRRIVQSLRAPAAAPAGLSAAQRFVLAQLADEDGATIGELARRTATHQSSVSVVVAKLARAGLVKRERSPTDARAVVARLTPRGRRAAKSAGPLPQDALVDGLAKMPAARRRQLAALLAEWTRHSGLPETPPAMFFEPAPRKASPAR